METHEWHKLSSQVDSLIQTRNQLTGENHWLREQLSKAKGEIAVLTDLKQKAAYDIKRLIRHLKDEIQ